MQQNIVNFLYVHRPRVEGNIVYFSWNMDFDPQKSTNEIYVDYYDIDISEIPLQVHYNTIIGLILNHLVTLDIPTIVITKDLISEDIASFWTSYHGLQNVYFANAIPMQIEKAVKPSISIGYAGILYGGGKDSYYALDILSKNSNIKKISIISFVIPDSHVNIKELEERRDKLILDKISKKYDVGVIKIRTNARSIIKDYHLELYFAPLGVLAWLNMFNYVTFSYEFCHYFIRSGDEDNFGFHRSQFSFINELNKFYSKQFTHNPLTIFNANQHLSELSSFGYLANINPNFYQDLIMCESTTDKNKKWCCSCTKCAEFVLFSMFYQLNQSDIDLEYFFTESPWIVKMVKNIHHKFESKGSFIQGSVFSLHFDSFKFVLNQLKQRNIKFSNLKAQENFNLLIDYYTNSSEQSCDEDGFYVDILHQIYPQELLNDTYHILNNYLPMKNSPTKKTSGIGNLFFHKETQPQWISRNIKILPNTVYQLLVDKNNFPMFNSDPLNGYITACRVVPFNIHKEEFNIKSNNHYLDVQILKNPLIKEDGYSIEVEIVNVQNYPYGTFLVEIPHHSKDLDERFDITIEINGINHKSLLLTERNTQFYFNLNTTNNNSNIIKITLSAKKDLESWNWGKAARIRLYNIKFYKQKNIFNKQEVII